MLVMITMTIMIVMIEIMNYARKFHSNATGLHDVDGDDEHDYDDEFDEKTSC